jgi:Leucine-rich repeat (LRR) protein
LTGTIPSSVGEVSNLVILQLYMNRLSGELPTQIGNLKHLETRFNNELEGEIPSSLYQVGTLKTLLLSSNKFGN